jgi:hypothetical protein
MPATAKKSKKKVKKAAKKKEQTPAAQLVALVGAAEADSKKTKSAHPEVAVDPRTLEEYFKQREIAKTATTAAAKILDTLAPGFEAARVEASQQEKECVSSLDVNGTATFTQPHKYGKIEGRKARQIRPTFGEDFDRYFEKVVTGSLNMEFLANNPETARLLFRALAQVCKEQGVRPKEVLNVSRVLAPTTAYSADRVLIDEVKEKAERVRASKLVVPAKPTLTKPQHAKKKK